MAVSLPQDFVSLMEEQYGTDVASALCHALVHTAPEVSVRFNRHKCTQLLRSVHDMASGNTADAGITPVPWCPEGFYLAERPSFTMDPLLHVGVYYVQEASSMYLSEVIRRHSDVVSAVRSAPCSVLDLCAAPGGKSTLLAGMMREGDTLVCNEPMPKRAQVLSENMQKWTRMLRGSYPVRCVVTQQYPSAFSRCNDCFDVIVVDAPCSGEGMFRKDEEAVRQWNRELVLNCQARQREILTDVWPCLRKGGLLVYSTCTFNHYEDEDNAAWVQEHLGATLLESRHFLPGRDRGEGFYIAALRKDDERDTAGCRRVLDARMLHTLFDSDAQRVADDVVVELTYDEALHYLRGEALHIAAPRGMVTLTYKGFAIGSGKSVGTRINNLYPASWRIRTTHLTECRIFDF